MNCWPLGSSPLARGLLSPGNYEIDLNRIIPARAGFTASRSPKAVPERDHPRSRGVYGRCRRARQWCRGSSPLARGLPEDALEAGDLLGIIPARAGFTRAQRSRWPAGPDHPRSRGVYAAIMRHTSAVAGSSPLARGLPVSVALLFCRFRIIPARAGFTTTSSTRSSSTPDHPRSRGVYDQ